MPIQVLFDGVEQRQTPVVDDADHTVVNLSDPEFGEMHIYPSRGKVSFSSFKRVAFWNRIDGRAIVIARALANEIELTLLTKISIVTPRLYVVTIIHS